MDVQVNLLAVLFATVAAMVIGFIWYAPQVFGNTWMKLIGMSKKQADEASGKAIVVAVLASFITAYVLAHVTFLANNFYSGYSYLESALSTAFWMWLGFFVTTQAMHDGFEQRPTKLTFINTGNSIVTLLAMGLIIGLMGK